MCRPRKWLWLRSSILMSVLPARTSGSLPVQTRSVIAFNQLVHRQLRHAQAMRSGHFHRFVVGMSLQSKQHNITWQKIILTTHPVV